MCKRLSLLAINSYLSWRGKRKGAIPRHTFIPPLFAPPFFLENVCKTLDLRKDKIMLCKTIKWHYLWPAGAHPKRWPLSAGVYVIAFRPFPKFLAMYL